MTAREKTAEEVRGEFMRSVVECAEYWAALPDKTPLARCNGLAFSLLNILDGTSMDLPAMDLVLRPHLDDKRYCEGEGSDWYADGQVINDTMLHEIYYNYARKP